MVKQLPHGLVPAMGLGQAELADIERLAEICNEHDRLDLKINRSILRARPTTQTNDFLYYEHGVLVGFLPLFAFNQQEAEISGMVHPAYRRRGIFTQLLNAACEECRQRGLPDILVIVEHSSQSGQAFAASLAPRYDHSEYKMVLDQTRVMPPRASALTIRLAEDADIDALGHITAVSFEIPEGTVDWYTPEQLREASKQYYIALLDGKYVGKLDVNINGKQGWIFGFGVLPEYRHRGYGRTLLSYVIGRLQESKMSEIALEVATENENALTLYQSCGFATTGRYDYYRLSV